MIKFNLQLFGGRGGGSGMSGGGPAASSGSAGGGGASLGRSPGEAVSGFFTNPDVRNWAGYADEGRAGAVNIAEVYGGNHNSASGNGSKEAADRDIDRVAKHIVAENVPGDQLKGSDNLQYGPMANNPRATLGDAGYNSLRNAIIDEAVKFADGNTRARREYRRMYGRG